MNIRKDYPIRKLLRNVGVILLFVGFVVFLDGYPVYFPSTYDRRLETIGFLAFFLIFGYVVIRGLIDDLKKPTKLNRKSTPPLSS